MDRSVERLAPVRFGSWLCENVTARPLLPHSNPCNPDAKRAPTGQRIGCVSLGNQSYNASPMHAGKSKNWKKNFQVTFDNHSRTLIRIIRPPSVAIT